MREQVNRILRRSPDPKIDQVSSSNSEGAPVSPYSIICDVLSRFVCAAGGRISAVHPGRRSSFRSSLG
jgi:hypothetical protein